MFPLSIIVFSFILILPTTTCFQSSLFPLTTTSQSHTIITSSSITTTYSSQSSLLRNITPIRGLSSPSDKTTTTTTTSLNLFFDQTKEQSGKDEDDDDTVVIKQQKQQQKKKDFLSSYKQKYKIPQEIYNDVSNINSQKLPYEIKLSRGGADNNNSNKEEETILLIRHLEMDDLPTVVRMCVKEFGSYTPSTDNNEGSFDLMTSLQQEQQRKDKTPEFIKEALQTYENFVFAFIVQLGLDQRIQRRIQGENVVPDHNVLCITKKTIQGQEEEEIIGISEVSLQPLNPNRTAPPFVLPFRIKKLLTSNILSQSKQKLVPYVSNVMVKDTYRGLGYGKLLMYASEGIAKEFYSSSLNKGGAKGDIFLHVDANLSGKAAQNLYWGMGYEGFIENEYYNGNDQNKNYDEGNNKDENPFAWMYEPSSSITYVNRGLYLVDGVPLLYMKKTLDLMNNNNVAEEEGELE